MIPENEIRIGNWFHHLPIWTSRQPDYAPMKEFDFQWEAGDWYQKGESCMTDDAIEPIKLTDEWIQKFGFNYKDGAAEYGEERKNGVNLYIHDEDPGYFHFRMGNFEGQPTEIKWVHQLQNLYFSLTGEELIIKS